MHDNDDCCFRIPGTPEGIALHTVPPGETYNIAHGPADSEGNPAPGEAFTPIPARLPPRPVWFILCPRPGQVATLAVIADAIIGPFPDYASAEAYHVAHTHSLPDRAHIVVRSGPVVR